MAQRLDAAYLQAANRPYNPPAGGIMELLIYFGASPIQLRPRNDASAGLVEHCGKQAERLVSDESL